MNDDLELSTATEQDTLEQTLARRLDEALADAGVPYPASSLYVNSVDNLRDQVVSQSSNFVAYAAAAAQAHNSLTWNGEQDIGVFLAPDTFDYAQRADTEAFNVGRFFELANDVLDTL
ncbi:hypothetical protein [Pseudomonas sp. NPDC007930]|uniref:hypothetical protein n=1 Tax=Pseudomonas sp. NPDC007930 TaxID=3364417 RepID=UPI0036E748F3